MGKSSLFVFGVWGEGLHRVKHSQNTSPDASASGDALI